MGGRSSSRSWVDDASSAAPSDCSSVVVVVVVVVMVVDGDGKTKVGVGNVIVGWGTIRSRGGTALGTDIVGGGVIVISGRTKGSRGTSTVSASVRTTDVS